MESFFVRAAGKFEKSQLAQMKTLNNIYIHDKRSIEL